MRKSLEKRIFARKKIIKHFIKFGDYNVGRDGDLLTLPTYMQFLLDLEPEEVILEAIDTDELTRMAKEFLDQK